MDSDGTASGGAGRPLVSLELPVALALTGSAEPQIGALELRTTAACPGSGAASLSAAPARGEVSFRLDLKLAKAGASDAAPAGLVAGPGEVRSGPGRLVKFRPDPGVPVPLACKRLG